MQSKKDINLVITEAARDLARATGITNADAEDVIRKCMVLPETAKRVQFPPFTPLDVIQKCWQDFLLSEKKRKRR